MNFFIYHLIGNDMLLFVYPGLNENYEVLQNQLIKDIPRYVRLSLTLGMLHFFSIPVITDFISSLDVQKYAHSFTE